MADRGRRQIGVLIGMFVSSVAAAVALVACAGGAEGTVVAKVHQGTYDRDCPASGIVAAPVSVPVSEVCAVPECWRLVLRADDGSTSEACVSREEYDRSRVGAFRHERTDT